jgi:DNA-binding transcriptional regulator YiaG
MGRPKLTDRTEKDCPRCRQTLPIGAFYSSPARKIGAYCKPCTRSYVRRRDELKRRARHAPHRKPRTNNRGEIHCPNCAQYLPATMFRRHPQRPRCYWAYCIPCTRELDRLRWRGERREKHNAARTKRQRRQHQAEAQERTRFVADAITLLRRRGFTKTEIARLTQTSLASLSDWQGGTRRPTPAIAARFRIVLLASGHLPLGAPAYRRRKPHPAFAAIRAATADQVAAIHVRNAWGRP